MTDDFLTLNMLIVSDVAPERDLLRRAAAEASIFIDLKEAALPANAEAAAKLASDRAWDFVLFDSRIPRADRQAMLDAIRSAESRPLAILIGAAEMKSREVLTDGLDVDGALAKPIDNQEARNLIESCCRARLPRRVLIVDDSSTIRSVIRKVFQASRYKLEAEEAEEGAAAVALTKAQRFDLVFLDCQMPGIDSFVTMQQLKQLQPDTKVVMITGTRDYRIEDRARAEGATDFLYKPFFAPDINGVLNRAFGLMRPKWN